MLDKRYYELLDQTLRSLADENNKGKMFGGKVVLVSGDFRQLLPVIKRSKRAMIVDKTLKKSYLWNKTVMTQLSLKENMRVKREIEKYPGNVEFHNQLRQYEKWLLKLGDGTATSVKEQGEEKIIEVPEHMCRQSELEVIQEVFDDFEANYHNKDYLKQRMILGSKNEYVDNINEDIVNKIPGDTHEFKSVDTIDEDKSKNMLSEESLNMLPAISGIPRHKLELKENTVVILLRNMNLKAGHCNGTRYIIKKIGTYRLILEKLNCEHGDLNSTLILPRIPCKSKATPQFPFSLRRLQFPIKIAYAFTINKAQGQSANKCGLLLPQHIWTHG